MGISIKAKDRKCLLAVGISFISTLFVYLFIFALSHIAPLGDSTLTYRDGDQQYLDILMYYKNVLTGKDSVFFSMSKYLGGNMFAAFTYYLASPFSLLVLLFDKSHMSLCVDIMVMLKACVASAFMALFLNKRFDGKITLWATVMLSVAYSANQYFIPQSSNFMWLDGAYMLPLMLLGVYTCINGKTTLLAISTALSLSFNWYTGIINCIFTAFWALYEWFSIKREQGLVKAVVRYICAMISGVLASGIILVPSLFLLSNRTHGTTNLRDVFTLGFVGSPITYFANYGQGLISTTGSVSVFAGSFVLVSAILYFVLAEVDKRTKISSGILMLWGILIFYWGPLVFVFSVFREVESFWYRYGYLGIFVLIFIAGLFWANPHKKANLYSLFGVLVFAVLAFVGTTIDDSRIQETIFNVGAGNLLGFSGDFSLLSILSKCALPLVVLGLFALMINNAKYSKAAQYGIAIIVASELIINAILLLSFYSKENYQINSDYVHKEEEILSIVDSNHDSESIYRIAQTSNRCKHNGELEVGYNEALAYDFNGISTFLSSPEETQGYFMQDLGYDFASDTIPLITNTNIATDSLLGVQYILSDYEIPGCYPITNNDGFKNAYTNPYALPMAFVVPSDIEVPTLGENPYENINLVYSSLIGEEVSIYERAVCDAAEDGFTVYASDDNPVYGWLVLPEDVQGRISIDGWGDLPYNSLFAPTRFIVPTTNGVGHFSFNENVEEVICYELKLDVLAEVSNMINSCGGVITEISNNEYQVSISADANEKVMLLIPYQDYMSVFVNGGHVSVDDYAGVFPIISSDSEITSISVKYSAPNMMGGVVASIVGVAMIVTFYILERKNKML